MKLTLYVADCHMKWNGIELNHGDLYGHDAWYGLIYSHAPSYGNFVHFHRVGVEDKIVSFPISKLTNIDYWETDDGRIFFEEIIERPNTYMPIIITTADCWDTDLVDELMEQCSPNEEVALYIDGDEATFFIHPIYSSPDRNEWGECIDTWSI